MGSSIKRWIVFGESFVKSREGGLRKSSTRFVYYLSDPDTSEICYVGQTSDFKNRYDTYRRCTGSINKNSILNTWLKSLKENGLLPVMTIIKQVNCLECDPNWEEMKVIIDFWRRGSPLLNAYCRDVISKKNKSAWRERISNALINKRSKVI